MVVKLMTHYFFAILLLSNFIHGSQTIQYYKESPYHTPKAWKKIPCLDNPRITKDEEEIATERAIKRSCEVGTWRLTNKYTTLKNVGWHSGCQTPNEYCLYFCTKSELQEISQKLMKETQHCLQSLMFKIDDNLERQKSFIHNSKQEYYYEIDSEEIQRRILLFEETYRKCCRQDSDSEDEAPTKKRQRTKSY